MSKLDAILDRSDSVMRKLTFILACIGALLLFLLLVMVCANIIMRPLGHGIRGTVEMSGFLCAIAVGLCLPAAQVAGSHICAGFWADRQPRFLREIQEPLVSLFCAVLLGLAGKELLMVAEFSYFMGEYVDGFKLPVWGMIVGLALGVVGHSLCFVHGFLRIMLGLFRKTRKTDRQIITVLSPALGSER